MQIWMCWAYRAAGTYVSRPITVLYVQWVVREFRKISLKQFFDNWANFNFLHCKVCLNSTRSAQQRGFQHIFSLHKTPGPKFQLRNIFLKLFTAILHEAMWAINIYEYYSHYSTYYSRHMKVLWNMYLRWRWRHGELKGFLASGAT